MVYSMEVSSPNHNCLISVRKVIIFLERYCYGRYLVLTAMGKQLLWHHVSGPQQDEQALIASKNCTRNSVKTLRANNAIAGIRPERKMM